MAISGFHFGKVAQTLPAESRAILGVSAVKQAAREPKLLSKAAVQSHADGIARSLTRSRCVCYRTDRIHNLIYVLTDWGRTDLELPLENRRCHSTDRKETHGNTSYSRAWCSRKQPGLQ